MKTFQDTKNELQELQDVKLLDMLDILNAKEKLQGMSNERLLEVGKMVTPGQFIKIKYKKEVALLKEYQDKNVVIKITEDVVRLGVKYENTKQYIEPTTDKTSPYMSVHNGIVMRKKSDELGNQLYLQIYTIDENSRSKSKYWWNGKIVSFDEVAFMIKPKKASTFVAGTYVKKAQDILKIGEWVA